MLLKLQKYYFHYFLTLALTLLYCTESLFCIISCKQRNSFNNHSNYFYHSDNKSDKTTNQYNNQSRSKLKKTHRMTFSSESSESTPWSNAFNFKKMWGTTVDPRTGILSAYVKTGSMISNLGHGPNINLEVNYNSSTLANPDGLGTGWSWNLTHFNPVTKQLTTSFGQNFYLTKQSTGHWWPVYHKLKDMLIQGDISTHFIITYANGLRETLNHEGYESRLEQQDGWSVHFSYMPGTHLLQSISDDNEHIIKLYNTNQFVRVVSQGYNGKPVVVLIHKKNSELHSITLPSSNDRLGHGIYFHYIQHFITGVNYPTGLKNRITYNCRDEIKIPDNYTVLPHALCAVVKETADPGFGQAMMISRYHYGKTNLNEHNYLGFNSGVNISGHSSKDRLFEVPVSYSYQTEQDNGLIREIRTYNKYHLMTDERQISDRTGDVLSSVHYFFCRTDKYDGCAYSSFTDLPVFYSLPLKIVTRVWGDASDTPAVTTVTTRYDSQGRVIIQTDSYGRLTRIHYCPLNGDKACPAVSKVWPFTALTESSIIYPAHTKTNTYPLSPVKIGNYYKNKINYNRKGYTTVLDHQIKQAGKQRLISVRYYYDDPDNLLTYGLLKKSTVTQRQDETVSPDTIKKYYYYIKSPDNQTKTTYSAIELSENERQISSYITTSLFTNQTLNVTDTEKKDNDRYYYDIWDRLVKIERAAGTTFAASIRYDYTVSERLNQVLITAVNGLQKKVLFDGTGRVLISFNEAVDKTGKQQTGHWWPVKKIFYDQYGRITRQSSYVISESEHKTTLDTTQDYDDTGRVVRIHLPDGETMITHYDDSDRCVLSYQKNVQGERSVISVSRANILSKPVKQWILPATTGLLPSVKSLCLNSDKQPTARVSVITYDGFGRQRSIQDPSGRIIRQYYDSQGQLTDTVDPAGNRLHQVYNLTGQVIQSWVCPVSGGHYLLSSSYYNAADQLIWHAGEDGKRTFYTYTSDGKIATITTANRHVFSWRYNILNLPVSKLIDNKQQYINDYDPITLNLYKRTDISGTTNYFYNDNGLIQQLNHTSKNDYPNYQLQWEYDNNQRIISTTDISGNKTKTEYDWLGRIDHIDYQPYKSSSSERLFLTVYDDFSRIQHISYGSGMYRTFHYDRWGNKDKITDTLEKQLISQWKIKYDINDNIFLLSQKIENKQYGILHYQYDVLDNLIGMQCQGSSGLPLCPHDTSITGSQLTQAPVIIRQNYTFTPLNRLAGIQEILQPSAQQKTVSKIINYRYTNISTPLRLQQISTGWNQNRAVSQNFTYDDVGNMAVDGEGNHITYNAMNEVTRVVSAKGKQSDYTYDGDGKEMVEKSTQGSSYLFYSGGTLINEKIIIPWQDTHITGYPGVAKTTDGTISEYYESSYKGDIVAILKKNNSSQYKVYQRNIYSPYGMIWHRKSKTLPLYKQTLYGFDGERRDPATGWQFLGAGHRTYNKEQRYFLSEDPAGDGYAFGSNNPVMNTDPSGNSPKWLGEIFKWADYISTAGLSALHQRWANITASVIQFGCTVATLGAAAAGAGAIAVAGVVAGAATIGSIPVIAAAIPANRGLNIAGSLIGMAETAVTVATGLLSFSMVNEEFELEIPFKMLSAKNGNFCVSEFSCSNEVCVFSGDALDELNLELPAATPTVSQFLQQAPNLKHGSFLEFKTLREVALTWALLRCSPFRDNIACDTGCILLAYYFRQVLLSVEKLENFLKVRNNFSSFEQVIVSPNHPYIVVLNYVLRPLKINKEYVLKPQPFLRIYNLFRFDNIGAIVNSYNHMFIVFKRLLKDSHPWSVYQIFDHGIINTLMNTTDMQEMLRHPRFNTTDFYGYMRFCKHSDLRLE